MTMNDDDRDLERYLDGMAELEDLPDTVRSEELRLRELLGAVREIVHAPVSFKQEVMREIAGAGRPAWEGVMLWWLRPRTVRVSPAVGGLAVAASVALLLLLSGRTPPGAERGPMPSAATGSAETAPQVVTRFVLVAPEAASVHVTGDFASWSPDGIALEDLRGTGVWTVDVPLEPGVHEYTFIIDGSEWRPDPRAVSQIEDGFGQVNSVLIVSPETEA